MTKKMKRLMVAALAACLLMAMAIPALASSVGNQDVDADVEFTTPSNPLVINSAPAGLDFGKREIALVDTYYPEITSAPGIEVIVHDARGNGAGWRLDCKLGDFANTSNNTGAGIGTLDLQAAAITFKNNATATNANGNPIATVPGTTLVAGSMTAQTVVTAALNAGEGINNILWADTPGAATLDSVTGGTYNIELMVKGASARAEEYTAKLNWDLISAP